MRGMMGAQVYASDRRASDALCPRCYLLMLTSPRGDLLLARRAARRTSAISQYLCSGSRWPVRSYDRVSKASIRSWFCPARLRVTVAATHAIRC